MERLAWCGLKLNQRRHAIAALDAQYRSMRRELERKLADFEAYFLPQAEDFTRAQAQETGERSVRTLGGLFGFRLVPGGPRVHDVALAAAWAAQHLPDALPADGMGKLDVARIKAHMVETGEVVPGCTFVPDTDTFYFKPPRPRRFGGSDGGALDD